MRPWPALLLLAACGPRPLAVGEFTVTIEDDGSLTVEHARTGPVVEGLRMVAGAGSVDVQMQFGAFRFDGTEVDTLRHAAVDRVRGRKAIPAVLELSGPDGSSLGIATLAASDEVLVVDFTPEPGLGRAGQGSLVSPVVGFSADCDRDDHFLGLGAHALDLDHVGEAFSLWVQEPGIGKEEVEQAEGWPLVGGRHDSSFPVPVLIRPQRAQALIVDDTAKIDVDLCASDPDRFELLAWREGGLRLALVTAGTPLGAVEAAARYQGTLELPPPWAFGPWNDAIRGSDRVLEVADRLRSFGASSTAIWTEDWKGGEDTAVGYHLSGEWEVDRDLYPDPEGLAAQLEGMGFHWMAYFSPFLIDPAGKAWTEAVEAGVILEGPDGAPYVFQGATFEDTSMVDLSTSAGRAWAQERMQAALDLGFDGWMADFAEWLPVDAALASGEDAFRVHNAYPLWWQQTNRELLDGTDAVCFVRSGWLGTGGLVPVVWAGDQRTSFDPDDGFPTVIPMGLGLAASGVPVFTHDVAGYQSIGNDPSDQELWFRWASLGAYSPILRTHHGAFDLDNWQFDRDDATTEHWVAMTREHSRLWPYRYGLAGRAASDGRPMLLPVGLVYPDQPWDRMDAWLLGEGMLVAPVLERGADGREVELPAGRWWTWPGLEPAQSGFHPADRSQIPVFVAEGATIPTFAEPPDTFVASEAVDPALRTLAEADAERVVYLVGGGSDFVEGDGTSYAVSGEPSGSGQASGQFASGALTVAGVRVEVTGTVERSYTFVVVN